MTKEEELTYTQATVFLDYNEPVIQEFIEELDRTLSNKEIAIQLFYKVRDGFIYDPYHLDLRHNALKASTIITKNRAWCVEKSIVLAAALRAVGIPARLGYGVVINHIGVERLTQALKRDEIAFHGYVSVYLDGKWVKTTPAFDKGICRIAQVEPLEWDGENDALFQAYQGEKKFMEYTHFYGDFDDVPIQLMNEEMKRYYPHLFEKEYATRNFSFYHLESK